MIYPISLPPIPEQLDETPPAYVASEMEQFDENEGEGTDAPLDDWSTRLEPWLFIDIPEFGVVSLQQTLEVGSAAWDALAEIGRPIEEYQSVRVHAPEPNTSNGAVIILMLPEVCLGDFNDDGRVDVYDAPFFTQLFLEQSPLADLDSDGIWDAQDQILFIQLATMPCSHVW